MVGADDGFDGGQAEGATVCLALEGPRGARNFDGGGHGTPNSPECQSGGSPASPGRGACGFISLGRVWMLLTPRYAGPSQVTRAARAAPVLSASSSALR
ncbi:hypothetical protein AAFF_G00078730 [Aldrovandia affinis]|uniref:Uncharacterized protein n=1 Tax=Aldrovandia affinis TaxID=143900 RepID=A0AAD7WCJ4_9TELE|nr:hypothetical protein AAFF_G00078730 [Aldrovandia affinis]